MSKNFTKSSIDWPNFMKLVPPEQRGSFYALKAKNDGYLRRVQANPATAPKINWEEYSKLISDKSMLEKFKSQYESVQVPYPADTLTQEVDKQWQALGPEIKKFIDELEVLKKQSKGELKRLNSLPKFNDMTLEMYYDMYPKEALDPVKKPTFWPHCADEQLGWVDPSTKAKH